MEEEQIICGPCIEGFHEFCYWFDGDDCDCPCHENYVRWTGIPEYDIEELMALHVYTDDLYEIEQLGELIDFGFLPLPEEPDSD